MKNQLRHRHNITPKELEEEYVFKKLSGQLEGAYLDDEWITKRKVTEMVNDGYLDNDAFDYIEDMSFKEYTIKNWTRTLFDWDALRKLDKTK